MTIKIRQIPPEGLTLKDILKPEDLDLEIENIEFTTPIEIKAYVSKITNVVTVDIKLQAKFHTICSRCLEGIELTLERGLKLNYPVKNEQDTIELDEDIRQELILDYPVRTLCNPDCRGLCPRCGKDLNEGDCECVSL